MNGKNLGRSRMAWITTGSSPPRPSTPDLQRRAVACWPDEHGQVLVHLDSPRRAADGVPDVVIVHAVPAGRIADPHGRNDSPPRAPCQQLLSRFRSVSMPKGHGPPSRSRRTSSEPPPCVRHSGRPRSTTHSQKDRPKNHSSTRWLILSSVADRAEAGWVVGWGQPKAARVARTFFMSTYIWRSGGSLSGPNSLKPNRRYQP